MKQVTVDNVTYKSFAAAWRALSPFMVTYALARKRLNRGWGARKAIMTLPIAPAFRRNNA